MTAARPRVAARQRSEALAGSAAGGHRGNRAVAVEAQIAGLDALATGALRLAWQRLYRAPPPTRLSRDLLLRGIAYKLQEQAYGGLSPARMRRLQSLAGALGKGHSELRLVPVLKPGSQLVRDWHGRAHTATALEAGFAYDGRRYRSLSQIATKITGSQRSGPLFFGLNRRLSRASVGAGGE